MNLSIVQLAAAVEASDEFHAARILLLLKAAAKRSNRPVNGITKLAKLDFLVRYPTALARVLEKLGKSKQAERIPEEERNTVEGAMIRFRYGPWDERYRRWLALLSAKGLVDVYRDGSTVNTKLTQAGSAQVELLLKAPEFASLFERCKLVAAYVGDFGATRLMNFIYEVFPEIRSHRWGERLRF